MISPGPNGAHRGIPGPYNYPRDRSVAPGSAGRGQSLCRNRKNNPGSSAHGWTIQRNHTYRSPRKAFTVENLSVLDPTRERKRWTSFSRCLREIYRESERLGSQSKHDPRPVIADLNWSRVDPTRRGLLTLERTETSAAGGSLDRHTGLRLSRP